jgi:acetylornithine deacetylase/succinyl-diaminopimelate desuccinylase-like protein
MSKVTDLLYKLISIPSINPAIGNKTELQGEARVAAYLKQYFESYGVDTTLEEVEPGRSNIIARFAPVDGRPRILFGPHMDTVGVEGMDSPFEADTRDGKIYGRGACDTKGPMASMICALLENKEALANSPVAIDFVGFVDEEFAQVGAKAFAEKYADDYIFALAGEPTECQIVHANRGSLWFTLEAQGVSTHSSTPHLGRNAINELSQAIQDLIAYGSDLEQYTNPILGQPTLSLAMIRGGEAFNQVPHSAELDVDMRITPEFLSQEGGAEKALKAIFSSHQHIEIKKYGHSAPLVTPTNLPILTHLMSSLGYSEAVTSPGCTDAAPLSAAGIPAITTGPGSIKTAHQIDEHIDIADLESGVDYFNKIIHSLSNYTA